MKHPFLFLLAASALLLPACNKSEPPAGKKSEAPAPPTPPAITERAPDPQPEEPWIPAADSPDWEPFNTTDKATVTIKDHEIHLGAGDGVIGVGYRGKRPVPVVDYELSYEGKKVDGSDFFAAATFPVRSRETCATFINGGWGGGVTGISCIDFGSANDNKSTSYRDYETNRWYKFRIQVTADMLIVYIDNEKAIRCKITDNKINVRLEVESCQPLGFATWQTSGIVRNIAIRKLKPGEVPIDPDAQ